MTNDSSTLNLSAPVPPLVSKTAESLTSQALIKNKKVAFIRKGTTPIANESTFKSLKTQYPTVELEIIDLTEWFRTHLFIFFIGSVATFIEYFADIITKKKNAKECFWRTKFTFKIIKWIIARRINPQEYAFTFQMQSLFDASTKTVPHFVYTDHTNLENLHYPIINEAQLYPQKVIDMERSIYQNATMIFTRSHNITRSIVKEYHCSPDKVLCVYAGSNTPVYDYIELDNDHYSNKNILFVGIDWERKSGPELVDAFAKVLAHHPDAKLTIVGASPEVNLPNVNIVGRVPVEEVSQYYRQASIFCMPTKLEPFGIVFVEAMSYKLPLIGTNIGAIPDLIEHGRNGYLITPGDVDALAKYLIDLLDSPEKCCRFGEYSYHIVAKRYNWHSVSERMAEQINKSLAK